MIPGATTLDMDDFVSQIKQLNLGQRGWHGGQDLPDVRVRISLLQAATVLYCFLFYCKIKKVK
ncbi:hypothetical protein RHGRI_003831 [Rhododendron griersonianum]|uniref:Uncharacterized protein n=1 Tax=Rhododendron griersonianum TaxID=479676 RepID=A0AAV6L6F2_9ERIC|nr:hypothetical protein RHGRI_003831 [Rhododendron griersonianum]